MADRDALLDAAERVIARDGHAVSLEAIAVDAGVTKPIVYARIGGRADLSDALAGRLTERLNTAANASVVAAGASDREKLAALFRTVLETIGGHRELFLYVTRGTAADTSERTLVLAGRSATPLARLLADWRTHDGHDPAVALPWAYAIIGMLNLVCLWWMEESDLPAPTVADQLVELVWPGLHFGH